MSNIKVKKAYENLVAYLEANKNKKVSTILTDTEFLAIVTPKQTAKNFRVNEAGEVTHIFCYYHKEWENVHEVAYGNKASSVTGLNFMCKQGVNAWTRQRREAKAADADLLADLLAGLVTSDEAQAVKEEIDAAKHRIVPLITETK